MLESKVIQLFRVLARIENAAPYRDLTDAAIAAVLAELRPDADPEDERLCGYAAAKANLLYQNMIAAASPAPTYAGTVAGNKNDVIYCTLAEWLVRSYRAIAAPLLRDDAFFFTSV